MLRSRFVAAAIGFAVTLAVGSVEATQGCGDVGLTGEHFGACSPSKRGPIPGTLEELLQALDQRLPKVLRDRCTEDEDSMCDCTLEAELWNCWSFPASRTPLVKWLSDQGVRTIHGIVKLSIVWLKRRIHGQDLRIDEEIARYLAEDKEREADYNLGVGSRGLRSPPTYPQLIYTALAHHGQVKTSSSRRSHPCSRCRDARGTRSQRRFCSGWQSAPR
jgi:hypothetical protein